jgi:hypothetical protein
MECSCMAWMASITPSRLAHVDIIFLQTNAHFAIVRLCCSIVRTCWTLARDRDTPAESFRRIAANHAAPTRKVPAVNRRDSTDGDIASANNTSSA